jgi:hypothetical protein
VRRSAIFLLFFVAMSFALFGRSLRYGFVYDDRPKIVDNGAIANLNDLGRAWLDPASQSSDDSLNRHTFRPLFVVLTALERRGFGDHAIRYRTVNIVLHGLNTFLVASLGVILLELSVPAAIATGLLFLIHPAQVESVVWVVEQSNLLCAAGILAGLFFWTRFLLRRKREAFVLVLLCYAAALLVRENAVMFPMAAGVAAVYLKRSRRIERWPLKSLSLLFTAAIAMVFWRSAALHQTSQSVPPSLAAHAGLICSSLLFSLKMLIFPYPITVNHLYRPVGLWAWPVLILPVIFWFAKKNRTAWVCAAFYGVFWLPTAQIIPIAAFFAERFLYLPLAAFAWGVGRLWVVAETTAQKRTVRASVAIVAGLFLSLTLHALPAWQNDVTLWSHAARITPANWRVWYNLAESEKIVRGPAYTDDRAALGRIKNDLVKALQCSLPSDYADDVFIDLAKTDYLLGETDEAEQHAQRALQLNPRWAAEWTRFKAR